MLRWNTVKFLIHEVIIKTINDKDFWIDINSKLKREINGLLFLSRSTRIPMFLVVSSNLKIRSTIERVTLCIHYFIKSRVKINSLTPTFINKFGVSSYKWNF